MSGVPVAPWVLGGESLVAVVRGSRGRSPGALPYGLRHLPGPVLVVGSAYTGSPVGPYLELAVLEPARLGLRPGWCVTTMAVDSAEARMGGRLNWGYPKELGSLTWEVDGGVRELRWAERGIVLRGEPGRLVLPFVVPVRSLQRRDDGPVVVPGRLRGRARSARVTVEVPDGDALARLAGSWRGMCVSSLRFLVKPARHPVGLTSSLLAPLRAPAPALT
jgi:hypothetical protein